MVMFNSAAHKFTFLAHLLSKVGRNLWRSAALLFGRIDLRKPIHALVIGVILAGLLAPVLNFLAQEQRYKLSDSQTGVMARPNATLASKLEYDSVKKANFFNRDAEVDTEKGEKIKTGSGGKKGDSVYSATMPEQPGKGIKITDNAHATAVTMSPQFATLNGRIEGSRVLYPLKDGSGILALTPKSNGIKEDIVLGHAVGDRLEYVYRLMLPEGLDAKLMPDGGVGFYSGDPALFANITYGSETDRDNVEKARKNAVKNYLMFAIPAPIIRQSAGGSMAVKARFELVGSDLKLIASGLTKAAYPVSIDPTFVITSASEFKLGALEDNIDLATADQIGRATITGGALGNWAAAVAGNLPTTGGPGGTGCSNGGTDYNFGLTAYNGYLYLMGGGDGAQTYTCYTSIDSSNGTLGGWTAATNAFATGRTGAAVVGWNGYLYVMGGESANGGSQFTTVEYSKIASNGSPGTWATTSAITTGRAYLGATVYKGIIYVFGGAGNKNNGLLKATTEYAKIKADGTLSSWTATTSFTTARDRMGATAYNGFVYLMGGFTGSAAADVQYAPINSDGTLGAWVATSSMLGSRRSMGYGVDRGYLYAFGGCSTGPACTGLQSSAEYAPIHADGTVGKWDIATSFTTARLFNGGAMYNGYAYSIGGCASEPTNNNNCAGIEYGDSQYAAITPTPGDVLPPAATATSLSASRAGTAVTAYNGYLYSAGGCNGTTCATAVTTVDFAILHDDGTVGTWAATTAALPAARYGGAMVGFGGKLYFFGGDSGTGTGQTNVYSATLSSGNISAWTTEANTSTTGRYWQAAGLWANYIYLTGGTGAGGPFTSTEYTQIIASVPSAPGNCVANGGTLGGTNNAWCTIGSGNNFATARYGHAGLAYEGNLYVIGGMDNAAVLLNTVYKSTLSSANGYPGAFSTTSQTALPNTGTDANIGHAFMAATAHNSVLYIYGGLKSGNSASTAVTLATVDSSGNIGSWTRSARTLAGARWGGGGAAYNGMLYIAGGCSNNGAPPCATATYMSSAEYFKVNNGGTGMQGATAADTNPWTSQVTPAVTVRADHATVAYNGYLYAVGGCSSYTSGVCAAAGNYLTSVYYAPLNPGGSVGTWANTTALPEGRMLMGVAAYNNRLYVFGGSTSASAQNSKVMHVTINANGTLGGSWTDDTGNYLPAGRAAFGSAASSGFIYIAGGYDGTSRKDNVYYTQIAADGTLTTPLSCSGSGTNGWCTSGNLFLTGRQELSLVAYNSVLYVIAGYDGTNNLSDVQYATINKTDGSLGAFSYTSYQDRGGRARQAAAANGYLYFFGSENSATDAYFTAINANNTLGNLYRPSQGGMAASTNHGHGGVAFYNGFFYSVAGCTISGGACANGAPNNTVEYVGQKATSRTAHYSKLFDTQVDTAPSQFMLDGSAGSTFIAALQTASTGDPVLGTVQNINPAIPQIFNVIQALNSGGSNVGIAFNYFVFLTLDDSRSGTFPDTGSYITEFTIFYHANPGRRLRHGASFTNTGCNTVAANGCILDTAP